MSNNDSKIIISVVVCTYNRAELLTKCLQSLLEQTLNPNIFEVIIVDNNSIDTTLEIANQFAESNFNFRIFSELVQGHSHARNRGWREARGEYVAYIDDDAKATTDWCERILNVFTTVIPKPAAVGGQIHPFYEIPPPLWFTDDFEIRTWGEDAGFLERQRASYGFSGSNMAIQRRVLEQFGGFSAQYGIVGGKLHMGEDAEFFFRIHDQEPNLWYDPLIKVYHWVPKRNLKVIYRMVRSFNAGQSIASMQGKTIHVFDYVRCLGGILLRFSQMLRDMPISVTGIKMESVKFLEELSCRLGLLLVRK